MNKIRVNYLLSSIAVIYFLICSNLFLNGRPIPYDDTFLLESIQTVTGPIDYFQHIKDEKLWDIQPIRDLSYFLDIKLIKLFPFWNYHLSNFVYWCLVGYLFFKTIGLFYYRFYPTHENAEKWILFLSVVFFFHPVFQLEPFWISSRKHLLSTLFIFLAISYFLKNEDQFFKKILPSIFVSLFFLLSVFSQPITLLFPGFILFYLLVTNPFKNLYNKNIIIFLISLGFVFLLGFAANYYYYYKVYPRVTMGNSVEFLVNNMTQIRLLTVGRFFYQIFDFTMASPVEHDRGSIRNIIGLLTFPLFIFICYKKVDKKLFLIALCWFFFPIFLVIFGNVKLFALDTYLVTASLGIFLLLLTLLQRFHFKLHYSIFILPLIYFTHDYSKQFHDTLLLSRYAQKKEITNFGQYMLTNSLLTHGKFNEAFEEAYAFSKLYPDANDLKFLLPVTLLRNTKIHPAKKMELFDSWKNKSFYAEFYFTMFLGNEHKDFRKKQDKAIMRITETYYLKELNAFSLHALAFYDFSCELEKLDYCKNTTRDLIKKMPPGFWDEKIFNDYKIKFYQHLNERNLQNKNGTKSQKDNLEHILFK